MFVLGFVESPVVGAVVSAGAGVGAGLMFPPVIASIPVIVNVTFRLSLKKMSEVFKGASFDVSPNWL